MWVCVWVWVWVGSVGLRGVVEVWVWVGLIVMNSFVVAENSHTIQKRMVRVLGWVGSGLGVWVCAGLGMGLGLIVMHSFVVAENSHTIQKRQEVFS
ncbi:hypothetical protein GLOIN_2v1475249 [Rhizophagus irregularis DAOM 181602=DAOM 197198]|nr:hypothetical protein GLOIN_2v1475249 [Rhizophagus irregularis DAOM 181602=DAOM 197198]